MTDEDRQPELQRNVQRLLGRCLLRIQQYERLIKAMLAEHEVAGPVEELAGTRASRVESFSDKSLGTLVKALFEDYVVPEGFEKKLLPDQVQTDSVSMAFSFRLSLREEDRTQVKSAIHELVAMRNDFVHHLIDRFDLWTEKGCIDAISHLERAYDCIDLRYSELAQWAKEMTVAQEAFADFARTQVFRDLLVNGIAADGSFDWPGSGIVRVLREATRALSGQDGWTRLDEASRWVAGRHPEQTPSKYGCRTWSQVLGESRQFDLHYRIEEGRRVAWFRCR